MLYKCFRDQGHHCFRKWLVACSVPSHHLDQYWRICYWATRDKIQWNLKLNIDIFVKENVFQTVVCKMSTILFQPQRVKCWHHLTVTYSISLVAWWRHQMTSSNYPRGWPFARGIHRSPGGFLSKRPVPRSFDVFFDLRLNELLSK